MLNPLLLARIQFAFTISFHILFPAFSSGTAAASPANQQFQLVGAAVALPAVLFYTGYSY